MTRLHRACAVALTLLGISLPARLLAQNPIRHGGAACRAVALTFDLCPVRQGGYDVALVDYLREHQVEATFFASGQWLATHDADARRLLAHAGFELGTHGDEHRRLTRLDADGQRREIGGALDRLAALDGAPHPLFRPPFGAFDPTTLRVADALGLRTVLWSVVSGDPDPALSADAIVNDISARVKAGSIVIFHANGRGWHTREVVERFVTGALARKGLATMTVSHLLAACPAS